MARERYPAVGTNCVECTRDPLADALGKDVAALAAIAPHTDRPPLVVDLFAGSGNTMYWLLRHLPGSRGFGYELDERVFRMTRGNLLALSLPIDIQNADYR